MTVIYYLREEVRTGDWPKHIIEDVEEVQTCAGEITVITNSGQIIPIWFDDIQSMTTRN